MPSYRHTISIPQILGNVFAPFLTLKQHRSELVFGQFVALQARLRQAEANVSHCASLPEPVQKQLVLKGFIDEAGRSV